MPMMSMMYQAYQNHMDLTSPWRTGAGAALKYLNLVPQGVSERAFGRLAASLELISRSSLTYHRPAYGIDRVMVGNQELEVTEEVTFATPFGSLLHFRKENGPEQPRMLLVAPSWRRHGTRIDDDSKRISARAEASSGAVITSSNSIPENFASNQPRSDQDE